jgi:uncharacterized protein YraI
VKTKWNIALAFMTCTSMACATGEEEDTGSSQLMLGGDDTNAFAPPQLQAEVRNGAIVATIGSANLRDGPSTSSRVLRVVARGQELRIIGTAQSFRGYFSVMHDGLQGWMNGQYLSFVRVDILRVPEGWRSPVGQAPDPVPYEDDPIEESTPDPEDETPVDEDQSLPLPTSSRDEAIARAKTGVGYSYWWGGGAWDPNGLSPSSAGICTGACPKCTHTGVYGADCSGFVAKVWQVPSTNTELTTNSHPYSTAVFNSRDLHWASIDRGALAKADALVYNQNGRGHIVLFEEGDAWGSFWTYEARGCAAGIVHNIRTVSSKFKAIRRTGY